MAWLMAWQEMALEILARTCHVLISDNASLHRDILRPLLPVVQSHLADKKSILALLKDMRPLLNRINQANPHIQTLSVTSVVCHGHHLASSTYLDFCSSCICFYSNIYEVYLKFATEDVARAERMEDGSSVQVRKRCPFPP